MNTLPSDLSALQIGAFSAYNRRPQPHLSGLVANFYGENGPDSDSITALSLTKFQEIDAYIVVYLIKDSMGRLMKEPQSQQYPKICAFMGKIQRPKPQKDGMLAQFFASNGEDADQVNALGLSKYLDAFIYIEILKPEAYKILTASNPSEPQVELLLNSDDLEQAATHLTAAERKALAKKQKVFQEANKILLMSNFFKQHAVWHSLGEPTAFQDWLKNTPCCYPDEAPCPHHPSLPFDFAPSQTPHYSYIPLCAQHAQNFSFHTIPGGVAFVRLRHQMFIQMWAFETLKKLLNTPSDQEPDPQKIANWALDKKLNHYLPPTYLNKVLSH